MLSTQPRADRFRVTRNFVPTAEGMETRAGAVQVLAGDVTDVAVWGSRLVAERGGRLVVAIGAQVTDVGQAGRFVRGTAYQAPVAGGLTEDRFYVADGLNPLWYLARRGGQTVRESVVNTVLDAAGLPYPLPVPSLVASWRGRVWTDAGPMRLQHCQNNDPAQWDPLWTVDLHTQEADRLRALRPARDVLVAGFGRSLWGVTGQSQYDWRSDELVPARGVTGARALVNNGAQVLYAARDGVFSADSEQPLSDDVRELFGALEADGALAVEPRTRRLYVLVRGRVLAVHLDNGRWGEVAAGGARGLLVLDGRVGWYGPDGVWVMAGRDVPDTAIDSTRTPVAAVLESWDDVPNLNAGGRALLNRVRLRLLGSPRSAAVYTATADGALTWTGTLPTAGVDVDRWQAAVAPADGSGEAWPVPPVLAELVPRLAGVAFRHRIDSDAYLRLDEFRPEFRFRGAA